MSAKSWAAPVLLALLVAACVLAGCGGGAPVGPGDSPNATTLTRLFFLHHSVGDGIVVEGNVRGKVTHYNQQHHTAFKFWDYGYNGDGLRNPGGRHVAADYSIPDDNTDPEGLWLLWTSKRSDWKQTRTAILSHYDVIAFKSCFPNSAIPDAATLSQRKSYYLAMRKFFDTRLDKRFVVMSTPPLHWRATNATEAKNARRFANWLKSSTYLHGHPNVSCFDLFNLLARPDDGAAKANMLRRDYEGSDASDDSHPNAKADHVLGPLFAQALIAAASSH